MEDSRIITHRNAADLGFSEFSPAEGKEQGCRESRQGPWDLTEGTQKPVFES